MSADKPDKTPTKPQVLLTHHLTQLKLPTFLAEYDKLARECARNGTDHPGYLLRLAELELIELAFCQYRLDTKSVKLLLPNATFFLC